jgi:hypothetical protein
MYIYIYRHIYIYNIYIYIIYIFLNTWDLTYNCVQGPSWVATERLLYAQVLLRLSISRRWVRRSSATSGKSSRNCPVGRHMDWGETKEIYSLGLSKKNQIIWTLDTVITVASGWNFEAFCRVYFKATLWTGQDCGDQKVDQQMQLNPHKRACRN